MTSRRLPTFLLLAALVAVLYYPLLFAPFNSLDDRKLVNFLINREPLPFSWHFFPGGVESYYRPLISLSYAFDEAVWGLEESFMHLENILVHMLNVLLLFALGRRLACLLGLEGAPARWLPLVAAVLFAVHPVNVEAVAWITSRADLLAGTFVLGALYALLAAMESGRLGWGVAAAVSMGLGCLCKETALFFLPGAAMLLTVVNARTARGALPLLGRLVIMFFLLLTVVGYFSLRAQAFSHDTGIATTASVVWDAPQSAPAGTVNHVDVLSLFDKWRGVAVEGLTATGYYARKMVWPWPLNFAIDRVSPGWAWGGLAVWLAAVWLALRRSIPAALLLTSLGLACAPLIVAVSPVAWTRLAERYMYVPLGPLLLGGVFWLGPYGMQKERFRVSATLLSLVFFAFSVTTLWRSFVWQSNLSLYQDTVDKSPDFAPAKNELANALAEQGRREEGVAILASIRKPGSPIEFRSQVAIRVETDDLDGAVRLLQAQLEKSPGSAEILEQMIGLTHRRIEKIDDKQIKAGYYCQILEWLAELERLTANPFHWYRQGRIHLILGDRENARRCFAEAARRFPPDSPYREPAQKLAENLTK